MTSQGDGALRLGIWMAEPTTKDGTTSIVALVARRRNMVVARVVSLVVIVPAGSIIRNE